MDLPTKAAVRQYLREQSARTRGLTVEHWSSMIKNWQARYRDKPLRAQVMREMADDFLASAAHAGAVLPSIKSRGRSKALFNHEKLDVGCFLLEPRMLHQGWHIAELQEYDEPVIAIRELRAIIQQKKAELHTAHCYIAITAHTLERLYHRAELSNDGFRLAIEGSFRELLENIALSHAAGLFVGAADGDKLRRYSAVPFAHGLIILSSRVLIAPASGSESSCSFLIPSGRIVSRPVNIDHQIELVPFGKLSVNQASQLSGVRLDCSRTYIDLQMLTDLQASYYYEFEALRERFTQDDWNVLLQNAFSNSGTLMVLDDSLQTRVNKLSRLLNAGWMAAEPSVTTCMLDPYPW